MISHDLEKDIVEAVYRNRQEHIFQYWDDLNNSDRRKLINDIKNTDTGLIEKIFAHSSDRQENAEYRPAPYIALAPSIDAATARDKAIKAGEEHISAGKTAVLLVAGGQGTRLGFSGPKGMFRVSPVKNKSLFRLHAEKILKYSQKYNTVIPFLIMTSSENHPDTVDYFNKNLHFGLKKENVFFFTQNMIPSLDINGKILMKSKCSLCMNPDGHGGTLSALSSSGILSELASMGIETISYFQVDNPLVRIIDPGFIGYHILNSSDVSSKGVIKNPGEKVGVFVQYENGRSGIVEYSDMPQDKLEARDGKGNLLYCLGNIAVHLFRREYIESITSDNNISLPYHTAKKKIKAFINGAETEVEGLKFEKFIFDSLSLTGRNTILEVTREDEFAPVKNAEGVDSPASAKKLMSDLYRRWLASRNIEIPGEVQTIEISPLLAVEAEDLKGVRVPAEERVYLE